jgi:hypothetical protein
MVQHSAGRCLHTPQHTTEPPQSQDAALPLHEREAATRSALRALLLLSGTVDPALARVSDAELVCLSEGLALLGRVEMPTHA